MEQQAVYIVSTPVYPAVAVEHHEPTAAAAPDAESMILDFLRYCERTDIELVSTEDHDNPSRHVIDRYYVLSPSQIHNMISHWQGDQPAAAAIPDTAHRLCPFCNCSGAVHTLRGIHPFTVACTGCGATAMPGDTEAEAWHAWNTRGGAVMFPRDASLTAYVDDLLDLLQDRAGMSAEWCEAKMAAFQRELNG